MKPLCRPYLLILPIAAWLSAGFAWTSAAPDATRSEARVAAGPDTTTLYPVADTYVNEGVPNTNYSWVNQLGTYPNYGLALRGPTDVTYYRDFDNLQGASDPRLVIDHTPPTATPTRTPTRTSTSTITPTATHTSSRTIARTSTAPSTGIRRGCRSCKNEPGSAMTILRGAVLLLFAGLLVAAVLVPLQTSGAQGSRPDAPAASATPTAVSDTYLDEANPTTNYGSSRSLSVGRTDARMPMQFRTRCSSPPTRGWLFPTGMQQTTP